MGRGGVRGPATDLVAPAKEEALGPLQTIRQTASGDWPACRPAPGLAPPSYKGGEAGRGEAPLPPGHSRESFTWPGRRWGLLTGVVLSGCVHKRPQQALCPPYTPHSYWHRGRVPPPLFRSQRLRRPHPVGKAPQRCRLGTPVGSCLRPVTSWLCQMPLWFAHRASA